MKKNKKKNLRTNTELDPYASKESKEGIDEETVTKAEEYISQQLKQAKKDRMPVVEKATGANFGYIDETVPEDDRPNRAVEADELSPLSGNMKPGYDDLPSYGDQDDPTTSIPDPTPQKSKKPKKEKTKKSPVVMIIIFVIVVVAIVLGTVFGIPVIEQMMSEKNDTPDIPTNVIVDTTPDTDKAPELTNNPGNVAKSNPRLSAKTSDEPITVNESLAVVNEANRVIVSYYEDMVEDCKVYRDASDYYDIEVDMKLYSTAIFKDMDNLKSYRSDYETLGAVELYESLYERLENAYLMAESTKLTMDGPTVIANANNYIAKENELNAKTTEALKAYLDAQSITYNENAGVITYVPLSEDDNTASQDLSLESVDPVE